MRYKLGEICESVSETYKGKDAYVILVNTSDVLNGQVLNHTASENKNLRGQFKKTFKKDDILFSEIRPANKRFAFINFEQTNNYIASTKLMVIRADTKKIRPLFLFHYLTSQDLLEELQHLAELRSGTFPQITFSTELANRVIDVPSFEEQDRIVSVISAIEQKIQTNQRINDNLLQQVFALFDNQFSDINAGSCSVSDYILPKRGRGLLSKDAIKGDVPVVAGGLEPATYHNVANTASPVITISASGANAGFVRLWSIPVWSSDSSFIDSSITDFVYFWFVLLKKRQDEIYGSQTGSAQPHIYPQNIGALPICELDMSEVKQYNDLVTPLFIKIGANESENIKLAHLRDTLLPKLMAGEVDLDSLNV